MTEPTKPALDFLADLARDAGLETARAFARGMRDGFFAEIDGGPCMQKVSRFGNNEAIGSSEQMTLKEG